MINSRCKKQWDFIGLLLVTLLALAAALVKFYQRGLWDGTVFAILAGKGFISMGTLVRSNKADPNDADINVSAKMESTGTFIGNVLFALFFGFLAAYSLTSPAIRQESLVTTTIAMLLSAVLLARLPCHFQKYKEYREYKRYHD